MIKISTSTMIPITFKILIKITFPLAGATNIADRKSRQMLHQAKKRNPQALVVALGCYVQTADLRGSIAP